MAKNTKSAKERKCRKNISTLLSLMGFHDDDPAATIKSMREKLKKIQERAKFKKPDSAVRKLIVKWGGKTTTIPLKPVSSNCNLDDHTMQITESRNMNNNNNDASFSETYPSSSCSYNKINNNVDHHHHQDSARSFEKNKQLMKHVDYKEIAESRNNCPISTSFDQMMMVNEDSCNKDLKDFIKSIGGSDVKLVVEKELTKSDVSKGLGRLLIPPSKVKNSGFVTTYEKRKLGNGQDINVPMFDLERRESTINLTQWNMNKEIYVLKTGWNHIVTTNGLEKDMVIQVWSFRVNEEQLCLALARV